MKTLYIDTDNEKFYSSAYIVDEQNNIKKHNPVPLNIRYAYIADDDIEIRTIPTRRKQEVFKAEKGDIILTFYGKNNDKIAVVKNRELKNVVVDGLATRAESQCRLETEAKYTSCKTC